MRRLYFLTKEKESAETISHDLHDAGVADWNYKVVSRHKKGIYKQHVHSADMIQTSKFLISAERGALIGIGVGLLFAFLLSLLPIQYGILSFSTLVGIIFAGAFVFGWHGKLFGLNSEPNMLKPFLSKINSGYYLIVIDVPKNQVDIVRTLIEDEHPEARYCIQGSTIVFPFSKPKEIMF